MRTTGHRHKRTGAAADAALILAALAAVFGFAALAVAWGLDPIQVAALVAAVTAAAGRLVSRVRPRRPGGTQWGPSAATEDPRPQIAEPSRRSDRELHGPYDGPLGGSSDRYVTECGDVTSLLSSHPRPDSVDANEVTAVTSADTVEADEPVGDGGHRLDSHTSAARPVRSRPAY
ncbi:hypothetical protein GCM10009827_055360 [Dactylosporangium maewongense]|uniref:Uncharacterized protein n=1 Tax=Dactylosporangium maewongense TaxID=634393 RepID=A0ABN2B1Y1_9ACTN